jgi:hypothetical protein
MDKIFDFFKSREITLAQEPKTLSVTYYGHIAIV